MTPSIQEPIALNPEPALAADFVLPPRPTITLGRLAACWDRWVLVALALVVGAGATHGQEPDKKYAKEVAWSLKGEPANRPPLTLMGPDAEQCVRFEPAGLRIVLPNGHPPARPVIGLRVPLEIKGDFEITMSFAILQEPRPADTGFGTRITLSVHTSVNKAAAISRMMHADGRTIFATWSSQQPDDNKDLKRIHFFPTEAKTGQLRMARAGSVLSYYASKDAEADFAFLQKYPFGADDVSEIEIVGHTGGAKAALDVRVADLRIRAAALPTLPRPDAPSAEPNASPRGWLMAASLLALIVVLALATSLGAWLYWRRRRTGPAADAPAPGAQPQSEAVTSAISLPCSSCGRNLKANAALAGKKVKCPQCGKLVVVAASQ
jgi:predicted RNA-binding Zn-ribbon protein involved in translation (DUF1610 family)